MRAALEAEAETAETDAPPPAPPKLRAGPPARPASDEGPKLTPSAELEAAMRAALEAEAAPAPPAAPVTGRRARVAPPRLDVGDTVREALRQQKLMREGGLPLDAAVRKPTNAGVWIAVALISIAAGAAGMWYVSTRPEPEPEVAPIAAPGPGAAPTARPAGTLRDAVDALRALQAASGPGISLPTYQAKLANTQSVVGQYLDSDAPPETRRTVREILDLHVLAAAAWQARAMDTAESWESVSRSPSLALCTPVRQLADAAERPGQSTAQPRGRAIARAIPEVWECAARRLAQLDTGRAAR